MSSPCLVSGPEWTIHITLAPKASLDDLLAPGCSGTFLPDPFLQCVSLGVVSRPGDS